MEDPLTAPRHDVTVVRLYCKTPGSDRLRKSAAAELRHLLADGWQETNRVLAVDHLVLRLERPAVKAARMQRERPSRPSRN